MSRSSLKVLAVALGFALANPAGLYGEELAFVGDVVGLKIRQSKIKVRSVTTRARPIDIIPRAGEQEVETENAKIVALQGFDEKATCRLRLLDPKAKGAISIRCQSN